jgi:20S proteasome alpha/beta subunit
MPVLKPLPHIKPKPDQKRLPQVKAMTVAAGFICSDGIILCADSEHSDEISKFQRSKVFRLGKNLVLTGAGHTSYIRMAFDKLSDKYRQGIPDTPSGARLALEEVALDIYANHIAPFFEAGSRPYFHLLTGTRCTSGAMALVKSEDTAVFLSEGYETTGIGDYLFRYWADKFFESTLPMRVMSYLCLFMLYETTKHVPGCGGACVVRYLPQDPNMKGSQAWYDERSILAGFPDSIAWALAHCQDSTVPLEKIENKMREFADQIATIRRLADTNDAPPILPPNP